MTDPDLPPTLARLGEDLDAAYERDERRRSRTRRRRTAIALALVVTSAPAAIATRPLWDRNTEARNPIEALILVEGDSDGEGWQLSSYRSGQRLCLRFTIRTIGLAPVSNCFERWSGRGVQFVAASSRENGYVAGRVGTDVVSVAVDVGSRTATARAFEPPVGTSLAEQDGQRFRVFVASFDRPLAAGARTTVKTTSGG